MVFLGYTSELVVLEFPCGNVNVIMQHTAAKPASGS